VALVIGNDAKLQPESYGAIADRRAFSSQSTRATVGLESGFFSNSGYFSKSALARSAPSALSVARTSNVRSNGPCGPERSAAYCLCRRSRACRSTSIKSVSDVIVVMRMAVLWVLAAC